MLTPKAYGLGPSVFLACGCQQSALCAAEVPTIALVGLTLNLNSSLHWMQDSKPIS